MCVSVLCLYFYNTDCIIKILVHIKSMYTYLTLVYIYIVSDDWQQCNYIQFFNLKELI